MAEVTIRITQQVAGYPEPGYQLTIERTQMVDGLLAAGYAVIVDEDPPDGE